MCNIFGGACGLGFGGNIDDDNFGGGDDAKSISSHSLGDK